MHPSVLIRTSGRDFTVPYVIMFLCVSLLPSFAPGEVPSRGSGSQVSAGNEYSCMKPPPSQPAQGRTHFPPFKGGFEVDETSSPPLQ